MLFVDLKVSGEFGFCCCQLCIGCMSSLGLASVGDDVLDYIQGSSFCNRTSGLGVEEAPLRFLRFCFYKK